MKKLLALGVSSPKIELECEGTSLIATECLSDATKNHNFPLHMCFQTCDKVATCTYWYYNIRKMFEH